MVNEAMVRLILMNKIYEKAKVKEKDLSIEELKSLVCMYIKIQHSG